MQADMIPPTINKGGSNDRDDLDRHCHLFKAVLFTNKFTGPEAFSIQQQIKILAKYRHGKSNEFEERMHNKFVMYETKEFAFRELFDHYFTEKHYLKYDGIHSLSTWIVQWIFLNIRNLVRKHRPRPKDEGLNTRFDILDPRNKNFVISISDYEHWFDLPSWGTSPEETLSAKQLFRIMCEFFNKNDLNVMVGRKTIKDVITENGWNYDQYVKWLSRRKEKFKQVVIANGYNVTQM
ncbi:hypothetical protein [Desulfogranum marinum]|uniref:hypothetical protein n=1 Tax=Desulfogranum marinum TaxID=453220 RepID=UPI001965A8BD|nr:hypothetical protein [Desulfogranum marinum]MBM9514713.1 hypothetical protein [Desulfogranum marinum]